jgi:CDP-diglyceride synthetase
MFGLWSMIWFLTMRRKVSTIPEIATTFTGMFYLGFVPSFWVRIRLFGQGQEPTRLAPLAKPILDLLGRQASSLPGWIPSAIHLPITTGAVFIFWSWLCLAFNDVGAYFVGRKWGTTKLGVIAPAAGATSPNKSVQGMLGGFAVSGLLGILGAWVQKWPFWALTGAAHGILLGFIGLTGDLTASMLKRDAGLKDFGDLIPEHGGIMVRRTDKNVLGVLAMAFVSLTYTALPCVLGPSGRLHLDCSLQLACLCVHYSCTQAVCKGARRIGCLASYEKLENRNASCLYYSKNAGPLLSVLGSLLY